MTLRWLTPDGTVAAAAIGGLVLWGTGPRGVTLLLLFFLTGSLLTAFNQGQKGQPTPSAARNARQVIANGGWAAVGAALVRWRPDLGWAVLVGSLATAQADTWATEVGAYAHRAPRLITTGRQVDAGTSGGVTWLGTGAGLLGAVVLAAAGCLLGLPIAVGVSGAIVGVLGMLLDSVLGATLEARARLDNDGVNLAATSAGAVAAVLMTGVISR